nr:ribosomal protein S4 [Blidingia minima]QUX32848.1 30S ribosomal protein S4 [Blidingia minima]
MSRYRGPRRKLIRKLKDLPGLTTKRLSAPAVKGRRKTNLNSIKTPGQHGKSVEVFTKRLSTYGTRLVEKQKVRFNYHLTEKQLSLYVKEAKRSSKATGDVLLNLLEMRLDNVIYRLGMAPTIVGARQLVTHGHILVNQKKVNIPSYGCKAKDAITIKKTSNSQKLVKKSLKTKDTTFKENTVFSRPTSRKNQGRFQRGKGNAGWKSKQRPKLTQNFSSTSSSLIKWRPPRHLDLNRKSLTGIVKRGASAGTVPFPINEQLVIEFYS